MDAHVRIHLTRGDTSRSSAPDILDHEHPLASPALNRDPAPDNLDPCSSHVDSSLLTNGNDTDARERHDPVHPFEPDRETSDTEVTRNGVGDDRDSIHLHPQSNPGPIVCPAFSKEAFPSECASVPAGDPTSWKIINDPERHPFVDPREPPVLCARAVSSATALLEGEAGSTDRSTCIQALYIGLDHIAYLTEAEETGETFDRSCVDLPSSQLPSSSPPQVFSSSPYASSQSSAGGVRPSGMVLAVEADGCANFQDPHGDHVVLVAQDVSRSEPTSHHGGDTVNDATSPETDKYCLQMDPITCTEGDLGSPGKHSNPGDSCGPQSIKRPKPDSGLYPPPTPKRATLVAQTRQFKKLSAPFRPPLKLPIVTDGLTQATNNKVAETSTSATPKMRHNKIDPTKSTVQHKASNRSRSISQFKSPLVNKVLPADSRTVRLTPAVQTLERKLQLLKRAIKVKEDNEEEVLTRLATKWIEAGREVAYDVWNVTKDAGDFDGKTTSIHRSYGWESTNEGNTAWGWNNKPEDAGDESCDINLSTTACRAERLAPEEDEDAGRNTLGTMLRQLGITPETFGWDDDKETFSD